MRKIYKKLIVSATVFRNEETPLVILITVVRRAYNRRIDIVI